MEDDQSCSWLAAGFVKGEEHYEEDDVGRWSSSWAQSQELECEVQEEQVYVLFWTYRYPCCTPLIDHVSLVLSELQELQEWRSEVSEQKQWKLLGIARSLGSTAMHPSHGPEAEYPFAEVVWVAEDLGHHRPLE